MTFEHRGLPICPDLDAAHTLAGVANVEQGWGRANESWQVENEWRALGLDIWFKLGDRDIALHLHRREMQLLGMTLTQIAGALALECACRADCCRCAMRRLRPWYSPIRARCLSRIS